MDNDVLINFGGEVKAMGEGRVAGFGITFGGRDMDGEFFHDKTYYGAHGGDGVDTFFHHCLPVKGLPDEMNEELSGHVFPTAKASKTDKGIFFEVILDMADDYEKQVYAAAKAGKMGFSTGSAAHTVKRSDGGSIDRWIISELSFTPKPAEPRNKVVALKSFQDEEENFATLFETVEVKASTDNNDLLSFETEDNEDALTRRILADLHSLPLKSFLLAMRRVAGDLESRVRFLTEESASVKSGRTLSSANLSTLDDICSGMETHVANLRDMVDSHKKPSKSDNTPPFNAVAREFTRYLALNSQGAGASMTL
jgi:hypothetical protein